jgi:hypothetical protein
MWYGDLVVVKSGNCHSTVTVYIMVNLIATKNARESVSSTVVSVGCMCIRVLERHKLRRDDGSYSCTHPHRSWQI